MPPDPPSKSRLRRSKWALSCPYCQYSELCHARAYKQKKARNAPGTFFTMSLDFNIYKYSSDENSLFTAKLNDTFFSLRFLTLAIEWFRFLVLMA